MGFLLMRARPDHHIVADGGHPVGPRLEVAMFYQHVLPAWRTSALVRWCSTAAVLCIAVMSPSVAEAQPSTERLWPDRRWMFDVAVGTELMDLGTSVGVERGTSRGRVWAGTAAARGRVASHIYVGPTAWFVHRHVGEAIGYRQSAGTQRISALGAELMLGVPVRRQVRISASLGIAGAFSVEGADGRSGSGKLPMFGATLEVGPLHLSQKVLILLGAEDVVPEFREYYPITIGWRF